MDETRRRFLKYAGGAALLVAGGKLVTKAAASESTAAGAAKVSSKPQWGMVIDMPKLAGKNIDHIVSACHKIHNVPNFSGDRKVHEVKWIWSENFENTFPNSQHGYSPGYIKEKSIPVLCNHCENPPCVRACPTQATFQRPDGAVVMDFHRCIGCRFCVSACPYGARSLNFWDPFTDDVRKSGKLNPEFPTRTKGVVEKCNFCAELDLTKEKPYCVRACKDNELIFGNLNDPNSEIRTTLDKRFAIVRKPSLGTSPKVFYVV